MHGAKPEEAEDIAQEALARAWRHRSKLRASNQPWPWLSRIVRNETSRYYSRPVPEPVESARDAEGHEDDRLAAALDRAELSVAMGVLSAKERLLLRLRYGEDMTQAAIAGMLEMPEGTVKVALHRARARLSRALESR
jgi:RNA polymerase sigma-70 factor (ECF subfamily)